MAKQALPANHHQLWAFGQSFDFYVVTSTIALNGANFRAARHQKTQIVLHNTAGNSSAEDTITMWNTDNNGGPVGASANFVVERVLTAQAARPAGGAADQPDTGIVDAVRVIDEDQFAFHAGNPNNHPNIGLSQTSIGIEISNYGEELWHLLHTPQFEPDGIEGWHVPLNTCPQQTNTFGSGMVCNHGRARDENRWLHMNPAFEGVSDVQALDDGQYMTLILLLRHLCIRHQIPRQFFGTSRGEVFKHWFYGAAYSPGELRLNRSILQRFRGILAHRNVHADKVCPGVVDRNRLFRGITDEWWLPVQPDGFPRPYYSGPFRKPPFVAGTPTRNYRFRFTAAGRIEGVTFRHADLDALLDTKSYYQTNQIDAYYALVETHLGGIFPMGTNRVWHGGVHFGVQNSNPCVFAASGGTIVAARLSNNNDTDRHPRFGSQRFVLLKHAIFREMQADAHGVGQHVNYDVAPNLVFSLYMHLGPVHDIDREDDENPPWFNLWRRDNAGTDIGMDGDKGRVFAPNIQVSVGDILGYAGSFRGRLMIHFEIISHRNTELQGAPWDDANERAFDNDQDLICDDATLQNFLTARLGQRLEVIDPVAAARVLRKSKVFHKSEWALTAEGQVTTLIPNANRRTVLWPHIRRFSWVAEALAATPRLRDELGDADGMFWHYNPVTFMQHVNGLAVTENRALDEAPFHDTNVELSDDYYLTQFVNFDAAHGNYVPANVDRHPIRVSEMSQADFQYQFTRADIACMQAGNHAPESNPPQSTRFSLALLNTLESIHQYHGGAFQIALSHVCMTHMQPALCVMNDAIAVMNHNLGIAADIQPAHATAAECRRLWNSVAEVVDPLNVKYARYCGMPGQADLPSGFTGLRYTTTPAARAALTAHPQQNVPAAEVARFRIHLELVTAAAAAAAATNVNLRVTLVRLQVFKGQYFAGNWEITGFVNGSQVGNKQGSDANVMDQIQLDWPPASVSLSENDTLRFTVRCNTASGNNDEASVTYSRNTNPPWGIGTWGATSNSGSFILRYELEWDQSDF